MLKEEKELKMKLEQAFCLACASIALSGTVEAMQGGAPRDYNAAGTRSRAPDARIAFDDDSALATTYAESAATPDGAAAFDRDLAAKRTALEFFCTFNNFLGFSQQILCYYSAMPINGRNLGTAQR
ncbi:MAG: hypothetical protein LBJ96_05710 [Holosporaceae bacterium]|nr:hypothetical protein [Holosporaceae bacterium]